MRRLRGDGPAERVAGATGRSDGTAGPGVTGRPGGTAGPGATGRSLETAGSGATGRSLEAAAGATGRSAGTAGSVGTRRPDRCVLLAAALVAAAALGLASGCSRAPREQPLTPAEKALDLESFDHVWTTVREKHWDPELGGLDWDALRDTLRPRVENARTRRESREAMSELLRRLKQSHFGILPADVYSDLHREGGEGQPGFDLRPAGGEALVVEVIPGSPAESLGVRPGWLVRRIEDSEIPALLERVRQELRDERSGDAMLAMMLQYRLSGPIGSVARVRFLDGADRPVDLSVRRIAPRGSKAQLGNLPAMYAWIDTRRLDGEIGYIRVSMFLDPSQLMTRYNEAMQSFLDARGVVLDLRGNLGGIGAMAMGMAGWFAEEDGLRLGVMKTREGEVRFALNARATPFTGPVAVLVDGLSASTSEILAGGLQGLGRARVFGSRTAAAALPSMIERLPNGDGFQYAIANYISEGGVTLEGVGVKPDVEIVPDRAQLLEGRDPVLEAALDWIRQGGGS